MSNKIVIISPFEWREDLYPHLYEFVINLREEAEVDYYYFSERGYWIENLFANLKSNLFSKKGYRPFLSLSLEIRKLYLVRKKYKDFKIITIDNFIFCLANMIFRPKQIIHWSHDFVSYDNPSSKYLSQKIIKYFTKLYITKANLFLSQSKEREETFYKSIGLNNPQVEVFYLPVCLNKINSTNLAKVAIREKLTFIQIGGINEFRSNSISIMKSFDYNYHYITHGFIDNDFKRELQSGNFDVEVSNKILTTFELYNKIFNETDAGIISYVANNLNFKNIALASGQFAEFMRTLKPVIVIGNNTLTSYVNEKKLGRGIFSVHEIKMAQLDIDQNYDYYVKNITEFNSSHELKKLCSLLMKKMFSNENS